MGRYDPEIQMVLDMIKEDGQVVQWRKVAPVVADENKPWLKTDAAPALVDVSIAFVTGSTAFTRLLAGSNLGVGGVRGLMGAVNFTPDIKDTVIRDGETYAINSIDVVAPSGQPILYKIEFKK
jgi:hypothetical protein